MENVLKYILSKIVDHPDELEIKTSQDDYGDVILDVYANPEDMGRIIGKKGNIINSIRQILKVKATKNNQRFRFNLIDPNQKTD